ncbi:MAG: isoaspartyl peptidase/L-asparaginase [Pikeienuella sp.]
MASIWVENETLVVPAMRAFYEAQKTDGPNDTVGAIAMDRDGNFAAATSTSCTPFKPAGRVGDSPFFGAGGYAENGVGAAGATGQGEQIMRTLLSKVLCDQMAAGLSAQEAADAATAHFDKRFANSMSGVIAIDPQGGVGMAQSAPKMTCAWVSSSGEIASRVKG